MTELDLERAQMAMLFAFLAYRLHEERGAGRWGAVLLFPAIFLLLRVFKWEAISGTSRTP